MEVRQPGRAIGRLQRPQETISFLLGIPDLLLLGGESVNNAVNGYPEMPIASELRESPRPFSDRPFFFRAMEEA